ncbi:phosphatase PAP2 family protein [Daejeonella lutea]|uniref:Undecaprenyl-diphosphatase n=1 Tax=Daejeonella lutea TaxID=572036 RepID=A0A1T5BII3_9SPHI|nr:phosphatase PAP2 family protein [Daejeonella lutea]SKB47091.1 undecaprenyl-diphosphatase [Daejeonella lutea]
MKERRKRILLYVLGGIFLGFIALTILVSSFPVSVVDREFSEEIQEHQHPFIDSVMKIISWPGYAPQSIIIVLTVAAIFFLYKRRKESLFILLTMISGIIGRSLKILIDRPRPTDDLVLIIEKAKHQSFPSGHVLFYVSFFGFLIILMYHLKDINKSLRICVMAFCAFMIFTVPVSRIYLGAHWFTDVLGGALLGILILFGLSYFYMKNHNHSEHS